MHGPCGRTAHRFPFLEDIQYKEFLAHPPAGGITVAGQRGNYTRFLLPAYSPTPVRSHCRAGMSRNNYGLDLSAGPGKHVAVAAQNSIDFGELRSLRAPLASGTLVLAAVCRFGSRDAGPMERSVLPLLADGERARLGSLRNPGARARYLASRLLVKTVCGTLDELPARSIETAHAPDGSLLVGGTLVPYNAGIAHTAGAAALVLSASPSIGIDIEKIRKPPLGVAQKYFSAAEYRSLVRSRGAATRFFRLWTLKESLAKLMGMGLVESLRRYEFSISGDALSCGEVGGAALQSVRFESRLAGRHVLAVAIGAPAANLVLVRPVRCVDLLRRADSR